MFEKFIRLMQQLALPFMDGEVEVLLRHHNPALFGYKANNEFDVVYIEALLRKLNLGVNIAGVKVPEDLLEERYQARRFDELENGCYPNNGFKRTGENYPGAIGAAILMRNMPRALVALAVEMVTGHKCKYTEKAAAADVIYAIQERMNQRKFVQSPILSLPPTMQQALALPAGAALVLPGKPQRKKKEKEPLIEEQVDDKVEAIKRRLAALTNLYPIRHSRSHGEETLLGPMAGERLNNHPIVFEGTSVENESRHNQGEYLVPCIFDIMTPHTYTEMLNCALRVKLRGLTATGWMMDEMQQGIELEEIARDMGITKDDPELKAMIEQMAQDMNSLREAIRGLKRDLQRTCMPPFDTNHFHNNALGFCWIRGEKSYNNGWGEGLVQQLLRIEEEQGVVMGVYLQARESAYGPLHWGPSDKLRPHFLSACVITDLDDPVKLEMIEKFISNSIGGIMTQAFKESGLLNALQSSTPLGKPESNGFAKYLCSQLFSGITTRNEITIPFGISSMMQPFLDKIKPVLPERFSEEFHRYGAKAVCELFGADLDVVLDDNWGKAPPSPDGAGEHKGRLMAKNGKVSAVVVHT